MDLKSVFCYKIKLTFISRPVTSVKIQNPGIKKMTNTPIFYKLAELVSVCQGFIFIFW